MASIHKHPRSGNWSVKFCFGGTQFSKSLRTAKTKDAERLKLQIGRTLADIDQGRLVVPENADLWAFLLSDGKLTRKPTAPDRAPTLCDLMDAYFAGQVGQKEENTLDTERIHRRHFERVIGGGKDVRAVVASDIQAYINARVRKGVGPQTIKKEVATLRMWLYRSEKLIGVKPDKDVREMFRSLDFPKGTESPQFRTWAEIEAQIARTKPGEAEARRLWDCPVPRHHPGGRVPRLGGSEGGAPPGPVLRPAPDGGGAHGGEAVRTDEVGGRGLGTSRAGSSSSARRSGARSPRRGGGWTSRTGSPA